MAGKFTKKKKAKKGLLVTMVIIIGLLLLAIGALLVFGGRDSQPAYEQVAEASFQKENNGDTGNLGAQDEKDGNDNGDEAETTAAEPDEVVQGDDVSVVNAYINDKMHMIYVLSNGTEIDVGPVGDNGNTGNTADAGNAGSNAEAAKTYTVKFMDYNGGLLKTETVTHGKNATPPADPVRSDYFFVGWSDSYTNITSDRTLMAQYTYSKSETKMYTVKFVDMDGSVLKTEVVEEGKSATAPGTPSRAGYTFAGWDKSFENVTSNLTVTAQYKEVNVPTIAIGDLTAAPGDSIELPVSITDNPGILGMTLTMEYDDSVLAIDYVDNGADDVFKGLSITEPANYENGCNLVVYGSALKDVKDGEALMVCANIAEDAPAGTYTFTLSGEDVYDQDKNAVEVKYITGTITIVD